MRAKVGTAMNKGTSRGIGFKDRDWIKKKAATPSKKIEKADPPVQRVTVLKLLGLSAPSDPENNGMQES